MTQYVVVLDTPGIKKYIFDSPNLKDVRGASAILDGLNRGWLLQKEEAKTEEVYRKLIEEIPRLKLDTFIYANGGSGLLTVETEDEKQLELLEQKLAKIYRQETAGAATQLIAWVRNDGNFKDTVKQAHRQLRRKREELEAAPVISSPWARYDQSVKKYRAQTLHEGGVEEQRKWVSEISWHRKNFNKRQIWQKLQEHLGQEIKPPESIDDITTNNSIAVVYADGNAMGLEIKKLETPEAYQKFSEKIDDAVRKATFGVLGELAKQTKIKEPLIDVNEKARFDIILLGGDDILIVLPPQYAAEFVIAVDKKFQEMAGKNFQGKNRSLSFGIAVGNSHSPFTQLVEQAEDCLKNAKKNHDGVAAVDFHINRSGFYPDIHDYRQHEFHNEEKQLTLICRPFTIEVFRQYWENAQAVASVPFSRLYHIASALKEGKNAGHVGWIRGVARAKNNEDKRALLRLLCCWYNNNNSYRMDTSIEPWHLEKNTSQYICGFHDILELCELWGGR